MITVFFLKNEMATRRAAIDPLMTPSAEYEQLLAPIGSEACFDVPQGSLVFTRSSDNDPRFLPSGSKLGPNAVSDLVCFETVNGLPRGTQLKFVGWAATNNKVTDFSADVNGTVQIVGTCTAINVGPDTIPAMAQVYFDEEPYVVESEGRRYPAIVEIGQPGSEVKDGSMPHKFRPSVYAMTDTDIASITSKAVREFDADMSTSVYKEFFNSENSSKDHGLRSSSYKALSEKAGEAIKRVIRGKPPSFPLGKFLWIHFFQTCLLYADKANMNDAEVVGTDVVKKIVGDMRKQRKAYNISIGQNVHSQGTFGGSFDSVTVSSGTGNKGSTGSNSKNLSSDINVVKEAAESRYIKQSQQLLMLRDFSMIAIRSWLSDHYIGQSLSTSDAGAPLRLNLGYGGGK